MRVGLPAARSRRRRDGACLSGRGARRDKEQKEKKRAVADSDEEDEDLSDLKKKPKDKAASGGGGGAKKTRDADSGDESDSAAARRAKKDKGKEKDKKDKGKDKRRQSSDDEGADESKGASKARGREASDGDDGDARGGKATKSASKDSYKFSYETGDSSDVLQFGIRWGCLTVGARRGPLLCIRRGERAATRLLWITRNDFCVLCAPRTPYTLLTAAVRCGTLRRCRLWDRFEDTRLKSFNSRTTAQKMGEFFFHLANVEQQYADRSVASPPVTVAWLAPSPHAFEARVWTAALGVRLVRSMSLLTWPGQHQQAGAPAGLHGTGGARRPHPG